MLNAQGASTCICVCVHAHAWIQNVGSVEEEHLCLFENTLQARGGMCGTGLGRWMQAQSLQVQLGVYLSVRRDTQELEGVHGV